MSIKNYNCNININDSLINELIESIPYRYFMDYEIDSKISVGDIILLDKIKSLLNDGKNVYITKGYNS